MILSNVAILLVQNGDMIETGGNAILDPTRSYDFPEPPPSYMWYDTSKMEASHEEGFSSCAPESSVQIGDHVFENGVYKNAKPFQSNIERILGPELSGVYQCVMWNKPKTIWLQRTIYIAIAGSSFTLHFQTRKHLIYTLSLYPLLLNPNSLIMYSLKLLNDALL